MLKKLAATTLALGAAAALTGCTDAGRITCSDLDQAERFLKQPAKVGKPRLDPDVRTKLLTKVDELEDGGGC